MVIYSLHIYFCLEIILVVAAAVARGLVGADLKPQSDKPYLSTSLQDFWGRRWNLMVTGILRPTLYVPVVKWSTAIVGRKWAAPPAVMLTFIVSGLMHELIFNYLCRVRPTWESSWLPDSGCKAEEKALTEITAVSAFVKTLFAALWV